ncbi:MAG: coenzyme F420-0:L-glutamate ligase [Candidatus Nezhaarchaeales archaeon]
MKGLRLKRVRTPFWLPRVNLKHEILKSLDGVVRPGHVVVLSEKALSVALGLIVDEGLVRPSLASKVFTFLWMRLVWGYLLGPLCGLKRSTLNALRKYPIREGAAHKQLVLRVAGIMQAFKPFSEGGIDGSNLPYRYVSLPLPNPQELAEEVKGWVKAGLGVDVSVAIVDSDRTYVFKGTPLRFSARKTYVKGLVSLGFLAYIAGRLLRRWVKPFATPLALAGLKLPIDTLLLIAEAADRLRGYGAGRNVFEMAERFKTSINGVTWSMIRSVKHYPIILVETLK